MKRPMIHLMVGIPYSGKSTYIRNQEALSALTVVDTDSFIEKRAKELGTSYGAIFDCMIGEATELRDWNVDIAIKKDRSFVVDQTNITKATRAYWIELARKHRYNITAYVFALPSDEGKLLARREARADKLIPISVLADMINAFEVPTLEEGFTEIIHVNGYA